MTTTHTIAAGPSPVHRGAFASLAIAVVAGSIVFGLVLAAITFGAIAIAFPLAVPIAEAFRVAVSPTDVLIAERLASLWWVFAGVAVASLIAAAAISIKTVIYLGRPPRS
jgi:hypothetical protein